MTRKPKEADDKTAANKAERAADDDLVERPYYYDDSHAYEEFDPEAGDDDAEDDEIGQGSGSTEN